MPRTHGKLYDTWILPDWLEVPRRRRKDLAIITERFKATLDDRIKDILTSKPKNYNHPNESVLLPTGHWSSSVLSGILESTVPDSTTTHGPQPPLIKEEIVSTELSPDKDLALELHNVDPSPAQGAYIPNINPDNTTELRNLELAKNSRDKAPSLDAVPLVTIRPSNLPYSQLITLATPSLHVRLGTLSFTLDFVKVLSGCLHITQIEEGAERSKELRTVEVENIPTTEELRMHCSQDSSELKVQLQMGEKGIINIAFMWNDML